MGGNPGSSARCDQCRQRRRKCDLGRPCQRCLNAGTDCSGPTEARVYIHLNASIIHKRSQRKNLHAAFAIRAEPAKHRHGKSEDELGSNETSRDICAPSFSMEKSNYPLHTVSIRMLYASLADEFKPTQRVGIFSGDRNRQGVPIYSSIAMGVRGLLPCASNRETILDLSLFTLLTRYFGAFKQDQELINLARASYTFVLGEFRKRMYSMEHMLHSQTHANNTSRVLLCLCLALLMFELVDQPACKEASEAHVDGALRVLEITGLAIYQQDKSLQYIFSGLRGLVVPIALRRRRRMFLAEQHWLHMPFTIVGKTKSAKLHDLAIRIPDLVERTDNIIASRYTNSLVVVRAVELKVDYLSLREAFIDWFNHVKVDALGPIYWYTNEQPNIKSEEDSICIPNLVEGEHRVSFRDGPRAGLLAHYWSYRLEMIMGLLDLCKIERDDHMQLLDQVHDFDVISCLREAESLAQLIFETVPYLLSCLEGRITVHGPLEILSRYRERVDPHRQQ